MLRFTLDSIRKRSGGGGGGDNNNNTNSNQVNNVMEKLKILDTVKHRMEAARDVLREAESWSTLESEVTGLVSEQQFVKAAERLEEASRSMIVFQNTTEYETRRALMISLQNQLEASLSATLVKAIGNRDVKSCRMFYGIFVQIQRESEFTAYYFGSRRSQLVDTWSSSLLLDCSDGSLPPSSSLSTTQHQQSSTTTTTFNTFLTTFYTSLLSLLTEERTYIPAIFPSPLPILSSFIQTTLEGLSPSLPQRLVALQNHYGNRTLPELIKAFRMTEEFAVGVERILKKLVEEGGEKEDSTSTTMKGLGTNEGGGGGGPPSTPGRSSSISSSHSPSSPSTPSTPSTSTTKRDRRLSKRMSTSKRLGSRSLSFGSRPSFLDGTDSDPEGSGGGEADPVRPWETAMFEPFLDFQTEYAELEKAFLEEEVRKLIGNRVVLSREGGGGEGHRVLWEVSGAVFGVVEEAIGRVMGLTHGYGAVGLVKVVDGILVEFLQERRLEVLGIEERRGSGGGGGEEVEDDLTLEGLEYSSGDWTSFQFGLRLLDTCRSLTEKLGQFEGKLRGRLTILAHTVREARNDPRGYVIPGTTKGAVTLLRQSTLNSVELHNLLEPLEKPHEAPTGSTTYFPPPPPPLLPRARLSTTDLTRQTQLYLHSTILSPLLSHLTSYSTLSLWSSTSTDPSSKGAFDLNIPTFSLSPTETISRVGEGLFNLPRLFEVYADDDALAFSLETLPHVDKASIRALQGLDPLPDGNNTTTTTTTTTGGPTPPSPPRHRPSDSIISPSSPSLHRPSFSTTTTTAPPPQPLPTKLSAETVIATWLSSLTLSLLKSLSNTYLPSILRLSKTGANQLATDLDYILNVARALDVDGDDGGELENWREAVGWEERPGEGDERWREVGREVGERVCRMRGWRR